MEGTSVSTRPKHSACTTRVPGAKTRTVQWPSASMPVQAHPTCSCDKNLTHFLIQSVISRAYIQGFPTWGICALRDTFAQFYTELYVQSGPNELYLQIYIIGSCVQWAAMSVRWWRGNRFAKFGASSVTKDEVMKAFKTMRKGKA